MVSFKSYAGDYLALNWADMQVAQTLGSLPEYRGISQISPGELNTVDNSLHWTDRNVQQALEMPKDEFSLTDAKNDVKSTFSKMSFLEKAALVITAAGGLLLLWKTGAIAHDIGQLRGIFSKKASDGAKESGEGFLKRNFDKFKTGCSDAWENTSKWCSKTWESTSKWCSDSWQSLKNKFGSKNGSS